MTLEESITRARETGDMSGMMDIVPYYRFLGLSIERDENGPLCRLPGADHLIGNPMLPAIHGGVIGALLEATGIVHLIWARETSSLPKIINITVEYLRSARKIETFAQAEVTKLGRRVANVQIRAWQEDREKPVASANALFLLT